MEPTFAGILYLAPSTSTPAFTAATPRPRSAGRWSIGWVLARCECGGGTSVLVRGWMG